MNVVVIPENFTFTDKELRAAKNMATQEVKDAIIAPQSKDVSVILVNNNSVDMIFVDVVKIDRQSGYVGNVRERVYCKKGFEPDAQLYNMFKTYASHFASKYPMIYIQNGTTDSFNVAYVVSKGHIFAVDWWTNASGALKLVKLG